MGVENPEGRVEYVAAAFPSACGKTNLAMMVPPEGLQGQGLPHLDRRRRHRLDADRHRRPAVGDQSRRRGFFGVAPGTNSKTNPNMMKTINRKTIYTNVVLTKDGTVWWEGGEGEPPAEGWDWQGRPWKPGMKDEKGKPVVGRPSQQPLHRALDPVPVALVPHRASPRRADLGDHFRRPPGPPGAAGLRGVRLGARRVRRGHDGLGADGRPVRQARRGPPRPDGHAALLRLPHGRLLRALAEHGPRHDEAAQDLPRQLVPHRRERQVPLAGLRREPAGDRVDSRPLPRRGRRRQDAHRLRAHAREPRPDRPGRPAGGAGQAVGRQPQPTGTERRTRWPRSSSSSASGFPRHAGSSSSSFGSGCARRCRC